MRLPGPIEVTINQAGSTEFAKTSFTKFISPNLLYGIDRYVPLFQASSHVLVV